MYDTIITTDSEPLAGTQPLDDRVSVGTQSVPTIISAVALIRGLMLKKHGSPNLCLKSI